MGPGEKDPNAGGPEPVAAQVKSLRRGHMAEPPRAPTLLPSAEKDAREHGAYVRQRENLERRSMLRGLILLAVLVLLLSLFRAGLDRAFPAGWWRQW